METHNTLIQFVQRFNTEEKCRAYLEAQRWGDTPACVFCGITKVYRFKDGRNFKCSECKKRFSVTVGTIYENSKIPLTKWFLAMYLVTNHKKGVSSCQLARDLGITQKSAWFVLHRIREMVADRNPQLLDGMVEVDETFVGGRESNRNQQHRRLHAARRPIKPKTMVFGIVERGGKVHLQVVPNTFATTLRPIILDRVKPGATVYTDEHKAYRTLGETFNHDTVNHYWKEYVRGRVHVNSIEGFWSEFKRGISGIYHHASPKHLASYCSEYALRYNTRAIEQGERFEGVVRNCEARLKYKQLISRTGSRY